MTFIFTPDYHIKLSWLIAILLLTAARFSAGSVGRLSVLDPKHGSAIVDGRTQVAWRVQGTVDGEYVSVFLDGQLLVITSAKAEGSLHLLGAPHGPHELVITLSRTPMKAHNFVHGALHDETAAVEFVSISEEGGEWMPELASLRNTFLHTKQRLLQIDAHARNFEQTLQDLQTTLRAACGTRGLAPTREPPGCSSKCADTGNEAVCPQHRCSATCCQIAGRCVELEKSLETRGDSDWDGANEAGGGVGGASFAQAEARLRDTYAELLSKHRGFLSRQFALQSAPVMRPGASATVIWMAGQYAGMEADYIELLLDGAYRVAINDTDLSTYAPNAMVIVQETFPVHGKPSFWQPFTAYLASFAKYGGQPLLYQHELLYPPAPSVLDESDTTPAALPADSDSHSQMNELRAQRRIDERGGGV